MRDQKLRYRPVLSRRDFIKTAVISGVALASVGLVKLIYPKSMNSALANSDSGPYYFGTDSSWGIDSCPGNAFPQNFYIGRTGAGQSIYFGPPPDTAFNTHAASNAGLLYTHTFWDLKGPLFQFKTPTNIDPYAYGQSQATYAANAILNSPNHQYIGGRTIFADIEYEPYPLNDKRADGWADGSSYNVENNRLVLDGFIEGINSSGYIPGVYTTASIWQSWFNNYQQELTSPIVVWLAGGPNLSCSPCNTGCSTAQSEAEYMFEKQPNFGSYNKMVIYQFSVDYDISDQNGYVRFVPVYQGC